jgi:SAM-dependent methyltransferase
VNREEYERMFRVEQAHWWYVGMRAIAFALLDGALAGPRAGDRRILDAGCGTGANLVELQARGRAFGIDVSPDALALCRSRGVRVARAGVLQLPFADGSFDCVTSFDVLYHRWVADDLAAAREMVRVLRPGGWLLVRVPALGALWGAHDEAVHSRHRYTRDELSRLLRAAGAPPQRVSYANSLLLPAVALRRWLDGLTGRQGSDLTPLPAALEWLFGRALGLEACLVRRVSLPLGASVVALARKPTP